MRSERSTASRVFMANAASCRPSLDARQTPPAPTARSRWASAAMRRRRSAPKMRPPPTDRARGRASPTPPTLIGESEKRTSCLKRCVCALASAAVGSTVRRRTAECFAGAQSSHSVRLVERADGGRVARAKLLKKQDLRYKMRCCGRSFKRLRDSKRVHGFANSLEPRAARSLQ